MATVAEPLLMTVEQYRQLPERDDVIQELHWGELVTLTFPKSRHEKLQSRLVRLLRPKAEHLGVVESELAFRALPEYELRRADAAFVSQERSDAIAGDDNLHGSPELVVEVLSPSNTRTQMRELVSLCLSTGAQEFWIVDPNQRTISVTQRDGGTIVYAEGQAVPLHLFGEDELPVAAVFAHLIS